MKKIKMYIKDEFDDETKITIKMKDSPYDTDIEALYHAFRQLLAGAGYGEGSINNICYVTPEEDEEIKAKIGYGVRESW